MHLLLSTFFKSFFLKIVSSSLFFINFFYLIYSYHLPPLYREKKVQNADIGPSSSAGEKRPSICTDLIANPSRSSVVKWLIIRDVCLFPAD